LIFKFEYDENKSLANKKKHGIDFSEAQALWNNEDALVVPASTSGEEPRYALVSRLNRKCFIAIFTLRGEKYRIISVRRCRKKEEDLYEKHIRS